MMRMLRLVRYSLSLLVIFNSTQAKSDDVEVNRVFSEARDGLRRLERVEFTGVMAAGNSSREYLFLCDLEKIRFEAVFPTGTKGVSEKRLTAYDGKSYQSRSDLNKTLALSRHSARFPIHPYRTVLDVPFEFLASSTERPHWPDVKDSAAWDRLVPFGESVSNGTFGSLKVEVVVLQMPNGVRTEISFAKDFSHFPVRTTHFSSGGAELATISVDTYRAYENGGVSGLVPLSVSRVTSHASVGPPEVARQSQSWRIKEDTLRINEQIDVSGFTLSTSDLSEIFDADSGIRTSFVNGRAVSSRTDPDGIGREPRGAPNKEIGATNSSSRWVLFGINAFVVVLACYLIWFRRSNRLV